MSFERARALADAVLMEGYALYPYRASAPKNRFRWTFGVVAPRAWSTTGGCEPWSLQTQFLVGGSSPLLGGRLRFFQIERCRLDGGDTWDEGVLREVDFAIEHHACIPFAFGGARLDGRERQPIAGVIDIACDPVTAARPLMRVTIRVENYTPWFQPDANRDQAMIRSFASTHVLVRARGGSLLSAVDPPAWALVGDARCTNNGLFPVLVGPPGSDDLVLASPFIMQDHAQLAPESAGDLCDAGEIDELLTLRTKLLTDDEKRQARATDPRAAAIIDRVDALPDEQFARMHGATRDVVAGEMVPLEMAPLAAGTSPGHVAPQPGAKVRLLAPTRRTDAQDLLYAGHLATVVELREDVDGTMFVGVTVDDDPAAELHRWYGRCHYYRVDEIEVL